MVPTSPLFTAAWWRTVLARAGRQAVQVLIPVLTLAVAGDVTSIDPVAVALGVALAGAVVVLKALTGLTTSPDDPVAVQAFERAVGAAAGALLAWAPTDALGLLQMDGRALAISTAASAGLALAAMFTNPPAPTREIQP